MATYYVSAAGSDSNDGLSTAAPFLTVVKANTATLQAGDSLLFRGGDTFFGNLVPLIATSDSTNPVTFGSYATGRAVINAGAGTGISLADVEGVVVRDLILVGSGTTTNTGRGLDVRNDQDGVTLRYFRVLNVQASGFGSNLPQTPPDWTANWGWGIRFNAAGLDADFRDVVIEDCECFDNSSGGFLVCDLNYGGGYVNDLRVRRCVGRDNPGFPSSHGSGFGILLGRVRRAVVEHCLTCRNGSHPGNPGGGGGLVVIIGYDVTVQFCESWDNESPSGIDGLGFSLDDTYDSVIQYCYSHGNVASGYFVGAFDGVNPTADNNHVRFCISENDVRQNNAYGSIIVGAGAPSGRNYIYNNVIYLTDNVSGLPFGGLYFDAETYAYNNIVYTRGGVPFVRVPNPGSFPVAFKGNNYYAAGDPVVFHYAGAALTSLAAFRAAGQETHNSLPVGTNVAPLLTDPGNGGTVGVIGSLANLTAYQLQASSPLIGTGLDLEAEFDIKPGPQDYFGNLLAAGTTLLTGLAAYWPLDAAADSEAWHDAHGTHYLANGNTVIPAAGKVGNAARFVRASSKYLSAPSEDDLVAGASGITLACWVYLASKTTTGYLIGKLGPAGTAADSEYGLQYNAGADRFLFIVIGTDNNAAAVPANTFGSPTTATWHHVIAWHDPAGTINIQVNGGAVDSVAHALGVRDGDGDFALGRAGGLDAAYFDGRLDEVLVAGRVYTAAERAALYNGGVGLAYPLGGTRSWSVGPHMDPALEPLEPPAPPAPPAPPRPVRSADAEIILIANAVLTRFERLREGGIPGEFGTLVPFTPERQLRPLYTLSDIGEEFRVIVQPAESVATRESRSSWRFEYDIVVWMQRKMTPVGDTISQRLASINDIDNEMSTAVSVFLDLFGVVGRRPLEDYPAAVLRKYKFDRQRQRTDKEGLLLWGGKLTYIFQTWRPAAVA